MAFAVLDIDGIQFTGTLPFSANHARMGIREDGSVLFGFGDLRLNSRVFRSPDTPEPVVIYHNNHVIYQNDKVWDFDIAEDGSSFVVHEPTSSDSSRLVIRNLNNGKELHYNLESRFSPHDEYEYPYDFVYSIENTEIIFRPAHADARGVGNNWFFPVTAGKRKLIIVENSQTAVFANSTNGYFVDFESSVEGRHDRKIWRISHKKFNLSLGEIETVWERSIELPRFSGTTILSPNGKWLALSSWDYTVLSTNSGEIKLQFPRVDSEFTQFKRMRNVLAENSTIDDIGGFFGSTFIGDSLIFFREVGDTSGCDGGNRDTFDNEAYKECLRDLRLGGQYREYLDVFDMNEVTPLGGPQFRVETYSDASCTVANSPLNGLRQINGQLSFGPHAME